MLQNTLLELDWSAIVSTATILFLIMDPFGNAPIFNAVLYKLEHRRRSKVVVRELLIALFILVIVLLAGNKILDYLGVSQPSLSIAGGVLLFVISIRMIFSPNQLSELSQNQGDPFIVPLAVPLVAGPSTIAMLLLLSSDQSEKLMQWFIALFLAWLGAITLLVASPFLLKVVGERGSRAMERLMGMILVILATQMLLNGVKSFVESLSLN